MTQQFKFGDHDSIARQSTTQLADLLRLAIDNAMQRQAAEWRIL